MSVFIPGNKSLMILNTLQARSSQFILDLIRSLIKKVFLLLLLLLSLLLSLSLSLSLSLLLSLSLSLSFYQVTSVDANHCPGSLMFVFRLTTGYYYYHYYVYFDNYDQFNNIYIVKLVAHIYVYLYVVYLYFSYSWPNGWTEWADIFSRNP